ncbi:MAG: hypothetical protein ACUZ8H_14695 [Candidatus Anammoxibacter sp.]
MKCSVCQGVVKEICQDFKTPRIDKTTKKNIVVKNVKTYECLNKECQHSWLPSRGEERIYSVIRSRARYSLTSEEVKMIRETLLPDMTKMEAADLFNLNASTFIKLENSAKCTATNTAFDLLLRLIAYKKDNLEFIKKLHKKNFAFDLRDYELDSKT